MLIMKQILDYIFSGEVSTRHSPESSLLQAEVLGCELAE